MTALTYFRQRLRQPDFSFAETLAFIEQHYSYCPSAFNNGELYNAEGKNEGSCKLLGLALLEHFTLEETLLAFGEHYRQVCQHPEGQDHANIRMLQQSGLGAVRFTTAPLKRRL